MRTLLLGCGAIGGVVGAALCRAGHDLSVVTGNAHIAEKVRERGIEVQDLDGTRFTTRPRRVAASAEELLGEPPHELLIAATKATVLVPALKGARPLLSEAAPVLCMQNGLPEESAASILGPERVVGCVVGFGATMTAPGVSRRTSSGGLQLGSIVSTEAARRAREVARAALAPIFAVRVAEDLQGVRWSKLAINCATSTLGAAGGDTLGRLLMHRFVRRLALEVWAEIVEVARAHGVRLARVSGTLDIEKLALSKEEREQKIGSPSLFMKHSLLFAVGLKFRRMRSSMLVAIERGRRPEIDFLNGEVLRRGLALGVPTPLNAALVGLIHDIVEKRQRASTATLRALYDRHVGQSAHAHALLPGAAPSGRALPPSAACAEDRAATLPRRRSG